MQPISIRLPPVRPISSLIRALTAPNQVKLDPWTSATPLNGSMSTQDVRISGVATVRIVPGLLVHPFREGNGRTQRVFWNRVAADAGWQLDWRPVQGAVNDAACRAAAESRDFGPMRAMFDPVVSPEGSAADSTSALDRFALRTSRSIDQAMDAARIVGMD